MFAPLIAMVVMLAPVQGAQPTMCPIMGGPAAKGGPVVEYAGARYEFCCPGCDGTFQKGPAAALKSDKIKGKTVGVFLFDPVSRKRIEAKDAKGGSVDFNGTRYLFSTAANKAAFEKDAKKLAAVPAKESLSCPVSAEVVETYAKASGYADHNGVRYYFCCAGCEAPFGKEMDKYAGKVAKFVKAPGAHKGATN